MEASEMTFGIEIETIAGQAAFNAGLVIGARHSHANYSRKQVPYLPEGWTAEADGSISVGNGGGQGCEIVSPILKGAEGIKQAVEVVRILRAHGHRVNMTCGFHVHVGWKRTEASEKLARLITMFSYCELGLYAITGTKSRENGQYSKGLRRYGKEKNAKASIETDRYHALNLVPLASGTRQTVEFRLFGGTLNAIKVAGYIQVCLGLVERAMNGKKSPKWCPEPLKANGGWAKNGVGQSEAERLIGFLAWAPGYAKVHGGKQFGWISDAVSQDAVKKMFRRLSKQYDGPVDAQSNERTDG